MDAESLHAQITAGATRHGEDTNEPDHEVGDLQDTLQIALEMFTPEQFAAFSQKPEIRGVIAGFGPNHNSDDESAN